MLVTPCLGLQWAEEPQVVRSPPAKHSTILLSPTQRPPVLRGHLNIVTQLHGLCGALLRRQACNSSAGRAGRLGHPTRHFNVGQYRRKQKGEADVQDAAFFDHNNPVRPAAPLTCWSPPKRKGHGFLHAPCGHQNYGAWHVLRGSARPSAAQRACVGSGRLRGHLMANVLIAMRGSYHKWRSRQPVFMTVENIGRGAWSGVSVRRAQAGREARHRALIAALEEMERWLATGERRAVPLVLSTSAPQPLIQATNYAS